MYVHVYIYICNNPCLWGITYSWTDDTCTNNPSAVVPSDSNTDVDIGVGAHDALLE